MDWERIRSVYKMADSSTEWELFFNSLLRILDDCESLPPTSLEREMLGMRLEQAVYALQQVVDLLSAILNAPCAFSHHALQLRSKGSWDLLTENFYC